MVLETALLLGPYKVLGAFPGVYMSVCLSEDVFHRYVVEIKIQAEFEDWHG